MGRGSKRKSNNPELEHDYEPTNVLSHNTKGKKKSRKIGEDDEDTPRAFKRLVSRVERMSREDPIKSKSSSESANGQDKETHFQAPKLKIGKGESMADFSRRVNDAIPLAKAKGVESAKAQRTSSKQKAKAERLRAEYKTNLDKRRGRSADDDGADLNPENWSSEKRDTSPDPFARLEKTKPKFNEVADRPPELPLLKRMNNVPKSAGSLARREILETERAKVIEMYRKQKAKKELDT